MRLIFALLVLIIAVIFAVQNASMVRVSVFAWDLYASLAVVIVVGFALGVIAASLAFLPGLFRHRKDERRLRAQIADLQRSPETPINVTPSTSAAVHDSGYPPHDSGPTALPR